MPPTKSGRISLPLLVLIPREFASQLKRPFSVRYNPYTETIEVLDTKEKLVRYASNIRGDMQNLVDALTKLQ